MLLTVVIPVGPSDSSWEELAPELKALPAANQIVFSAAEPLNSRQERLLHELELQRYLWLVSAAGRAVQLNTGAAAAAGDFLWFLHADSRFAADTLSALPCNSEQAPNHLYYWDLKFSDGPSLMTLNSLGVRLRSRLLGLPFGDQGFCLARTVFCRLGGFDEQLSCGEDHDFVWRARAAGVLPQPTGGTLLTSARKYQGAWLRTTLRHLSLTLAQACRGAADSRRRESELPQ